MIDFFLIVIIEGAQLNAVDWYWEEEKTGFVEFLNQGAVEMEFYYQKWSMLWNGTLLV
jgi:hypothetical protein